MNIHAILKFLRELAEKDRQWQAEKTKDELYTAFRFNPFRFFRTDEMGLSAVLAFLLNPKETHGQRDYFLKSFLEYLNLHEYLAYDQVEVHTEKKFDGRPHDIVLIGKLKGKQHWIISIENKLNGAVDQKNQINDYLKSLEKEYIQHHLIYMPIWDNPPSKYSIIEEDWQKAVDENKASIFATQRMIEWLENCIIISPRIKQFVADFSKYIKTEVMGMPENENKLVLEIIENSDSIKMALDLANIKERIQLSLIHKLNQDLLKEFRKIGFKEENWEFESWDDSITVKYCFFTLSSTITPFYIGIATGSKDFEQIRFVLGIYNNKNVKNTHKYEELFDKIFKAKKRLNTEDHLWVANYLSEPLLNWNGNEFSKIPSGQLAKEIWEEIEPICKDILKKMEEYQK